MAGLADGGGGERPGLAPVSGTQASLLGVREHVATDVPEPALPLPCGDKWDLSAEGHGGLCPP